MKKLKILFLIAICFACENALDEIPKNFISPENYYQTAEDATGAIYAAYQSNLVNIAKYAVDEVYTDYFYTKGSWAPMANLAQPLDATSTGRSNGLWNRDYRIINRSNVVLGRVPDIEMDETEKSRILAEAHFLRAWAYLDLVRKYGPVPLRIVETRDLSNVAVGRSPVSDIYVQIESDLLIAEQDLPDNVGANTGRATRWAAKMILADVYMDLERWQEAADRADEIINSGVYDLVTVTDSADFYNIFATETSTEDIFSSHFSQTTRTWDVAVYWAHLSNTPVWNVGVGYNVIYANTNSSLLNNWDNNDLRKGFNLYTGFYRDGEWVSNPAVTPLLFKKYIADANGLATYSVPMIRYAEAFLIYAEAVNRANNGPTSLALERLNNIRRRAYGHDPYSTSTDDFPTGMTMQAFEDTVIRERAYEFMLEGKRYWDLRRKDMWEDLILQDKGMVVDESRKLHPLPQAEIDNNPALTPTDQNPGF